MSEELGRKRRVAGKKQRAALAEKVKHGRSS